jgi:hypothetical protein
VIAGLGGRIALRDALAAYHRRRDELFADAYDVACELSRYEWTDESLLSSLLRYREAVQAIGVAVEGGLWGDGLTCRHEEAAAPRHPRQPRPRRRQEAAGRLNP